MPQPGPSRLRAVTLRVMSVLLGLLAALLAAEIVLRVFDIQPPMTRRNLEQVGGWRYHCYNSNPNGEFQKTPDVGRGQWRLFTSMVHNTQLPLERIRETPWCVEYRISTWKRPDRQWRLREDRQYGDLPPPGVLRVAGIGDSFAMGEGVPLEKSLFKRMESLLGDKYEVVNHAVAGSDTHNEVEILRRAVSSIRYTRAVVVFFANDIEPSDRLKSRRQQINDLVVLRNADFSADESKAWYVRNLRIFQFLDSHLTTRRITRETIQWYVDLYDPACNAEGLKNLAGDFHSLAAMPSCRSVLVLYPLMEGLEGPYPLTAAHERVADLARQAHLKVLDLAPVFAGMDTRSLQVHPADHHPNGKAHDIAARAIVDWLRRDVSDFLQADDAEQRP